MGDVISVDFRRKKPEILQKNEQVEPSIDVTNHLMRMKYTPTVSLPSRLVPEGSRVLVLPPWVVTREYEALFNGKTIKGIEIWLI